MNVLAAVMVRTTPVRSEAADAVALLLWAAVLSWLLVRCIRSLRASWAHRAFNASYDRLLAAVEAYRSEPGLRQLGRVRAAKAYSCDRWQRVVLLDDDAEPDRSWLAMLWWVSRWERRYR